MRTTQTSEDQENCSAHVGDGRWPDASEQDCHEGCDPEIEWLLQQTRHVIRLKVEGFKKDELRVQSNMNVKAVIVNGKHPVEGGTPVRFKKTFKLEDDLYKMDGIRAKLRHGYLDIILPLQEPNPLSSSPAGEETKTKAVETKWSWWVLWSIMIAVGTIGFGAFIVYRYLMT